MLPLASWKTAKRVDFADRGPVVFIDVQVYHIVIRCRLRLFGLRQPFDHSQSGEQAIHLAIRNEVRCVVSQGTNSKGCRGSSDDNRHDCRGQGVRLPVRRSLALGT
jgi:hypothetical protein